jgi:hypothetical protein
MKMYLDGGEVGDEKRIDKKKHDIAYAKLCHLLHIVLDCEYEPKTTTTTTTTNSNSEDSKNATSTTQQGGENAINAVVNTRRLGHHHCLGLEIIADFEEKERCVEISVFLFSFGFCFGFGFWIVSFCLVFSIPLQNSWLENYALGHATKPNIPLSFLLHAAQSVRHNFVADGFCHVQTVVEVANLSSLDHVLVDVEALNPIPFVQPPDSAATPFTTSPSVLPHVPFNASTTIATNPLQLSQLQQSHQPNSSNPLSSPIQQQSSHSNSTQQQQSVLMQQQQPQQWRLAPSTMLSTSLSSSSTSTASNTAAFNSVSRITSFYTGVSLHKLSLAPRERKQLTLWLTFVQPGVYNVNNFFLDITLVTMDERTLKIPYRPQVPHFVSVFQS